MLPLGGWRGKNARTNLSTATRFVLKAGDHLPRAKAPAAAGRGFTLTAAFDTQTARTGVIVAQGRTVNGYTLFLADGKLTFFVRSAAGAARAETAELIDGPHTARARLDPNGTLTLTLDGRLAATAKTRGPLAAMPRRDWMSARTRVARWGRIGHPTNSPASSIPSSLNSTQNETS